MLEKILKGCRNRQREKQKELYKMFYGYGMSITLRYADSRNQAAEILNDAFMKVFTNIAQYDSDRPFKPWLRRIIINTAINTLHKNQTIPEKDGLEEHQNGMYRQEQIISGISYKEIVAMVQQLSPAYRTVFNLYVIEGFKHREIADMLGIAVGTSKSNLAKARQNLQVIIKKNLV